MAGSVTFVPTERDYIAANRAWMLNSIKRRWMRWLGGLYLLLLLAGLVAVALAAIPAHELMPILIFGAVLLAIQLLNWVLIPRSVRRMMRQRGNLEVETRFEWTDRGFEAASVAGTSCQPWDLLYQWFETRDAVIFLLSDRMLVIVPAPALTATEHGDLIATARRYAR
jgi:hypothetical protein